MRFRLGIPKSDAEQYVRSVLDSECYGSQIKHEPWAMTEETYPLAWVVIRRRNERTAFRDILLTVPRDYLRDVTQWTIWPYVQQIAHTIFNNKYSKASHVFPESYSRTPVRWLGITEHERTACSRS